MLYSFSMKIILGSQSPRRKEILGYFSLPFTQVSPDFDEDSLVFKADPVNYVMALSKGKAESLVIQFPQSIILTADTIVYREGKIYGKPKNEKEAFAMLTELSGEWHTVYTGITLQKDKEAFSGFEATRVLFNDLNSKQISHYIAKNEWADKAGGYAIQSRGGLIVSKIDGCYYNVMGLPINTVERLLKHFGIELWDFL
jgi:septum formation protein